LKTDASAAVLLNLLSHAKVKSINSFAAVDITMLEADSQLEIMVVNSNAAQKLKEPVPDSNGTVLCTTNFCSRVTTVLLLLFKKQMINEISLLHD